jgi:signal peptidase I
MALHAVKKDSTQAEQKVGELPKGARLVEGKNGETLIVTETTVLHDIVVLLLKIAIIVLVFILVFTFLFGFFRTTSSDMSPNLKDGDLVMYYRLDKNYVAGDLTLVKYKGETEVRRVIAAAGDCVDIDSDGLKINGALQSEPEIFEETAPYEEGIHFTGKCPSGQTGVYVHEGEIFVLADARSNGVDSRMYGPVKISQTLGKVNMILRRRGF